MGSSVRSSLVVGIFVVAACTPTGSDATTTTQRVTTTTTSPQPAPSEVCSSEPHTPLDSSARAVQAIVADVDGDGFDDTVTGYLLGSSDPAGATDAVIHVELASGWGTALQIDELRLPDGPAMAEPRRVVTMDGAPLVVAGVGGTPAGQLLPSSSSRTAASRSSILQTVSCPRSGWVEDEHMMTGLPVIRIAC